MSKTPILFASLTLALGMLSMSAEASDTAGFYAGAGVGQSIVDESFVDDKDVGYQVFGGYQFNPYFGVEAAYTNFGTLDLSTTPGRLRADSWSFVAVGTLPVTDNFAGYVKAGYQRWNEKVRAPEYPSTREDGFDPTYGLGLQYRFSGAVAMRAEYSRFRLGYTHADLAQVQLRFDF